MAKGTNAIGRFRGKMGAVVYSVSNGQQIMREYNPRVANPRTDAQMAARSRLAMVGKVSRDFSDTAIRAIDGASRADRRSRFNSRLYDALRRGEGEGFEYIIDLPSVRLSDGVVLPSSLRVDGVAGADDKEADLNVTAKIHAKVDGYFVVAVTPNADSSLLVVESKILDNVEFDESTNISTIAAKVTIPITSSGPVGVAAHVIPFYGMSETSRAKFAEMLVGYKRVEGVDKIQVSGTSAFRVLEYVAANGKFAADITNPALHWMRGGLGA